VGLTGGIASGKTAVSDLLQQRGAVIIDADLLAREVVEPGTPALAAIVERFGPTVVVDGALDRPALGKVVFADPEARRDLERIVHPAVRARAAELTAAAPDGSVVVQVIPLLVETGQQGSFDTVVVVDVDPETQLRRLQARNGLSREDAEAAADHVLVNSGGLDELERQVDDLWRKISADEPGR
jgi:dephospho-CoA kinase